MGSESPAAFGRRYAKSWVHGVATAALTAFGTLTFLDPRFAALAFAAYVLPPVVLYARLLRDDAEDSGDGARERASAAGEASTASASWAAVAGPTDAALHDVAVTSAGATAVGDDGVVIERAADGWRAVRRDGPRAGSRTLRGVDAVDDGGTWVVGDGGTVARFDADGGGHVDHSAPDGDTTNLLAVAAAARSDGEVVLVADGSGRVRRGEYRDGALAWRDPVTPGSGSSVADVALVDADRGLVCDTNQCVFETVDGGRSFRRVGVDAAAGTLTAVAATTETTAVAADDGVVHEHRDGAWTPTRAADGPLRSLAAGADDRVAVGDGGLVAERRDGTTWEAVPTRTNADLAAVSAGDSLAVAVGDRGTLLERTR